VEKIGTVISDRMNKTRLVVIPRVSEHPLYKKKIRRLLKVAAHDETNMARQGDIVRVVQCRPLSKTKRWFIAQIVREAPRKDTATEESTHDSTSVSSNSGR